MAEVSLHYKESIREFFLGLDSRSQDRLARVLSKAYPVSEVTWKIGGGVSQEGTVFSNLVLMAAEHTQSMPEKMPTILDEYLNRTSEEKLKMVWEEIQDFAKHSVPAQRQVKIHHDEILPSGQFVVWFNLESPSV